MNILQKIGQIGESSWFITANAHCWFAFAMMIFFKGNLLAFGAFVIVAAIKEFYFDVHYETNQNYVDGLEDFSGYMAGLLVAFIYSYC